MTSFSSSSTSSAIWASRSSETGFKHLAQLNHEKACQLADALEAKGFNIVNDTFFNEFVVDLGLNAADAVQKLADQGIIAGYALEGNELLVAATEMATDETITQFVTALEAEKIAQLLNLADDQANSVNASGTEIAAVNSLPCWDADAFIARMGGNEKLVARLCQTFVKQADEFAQQLTVLNCELVLEQAATLTHSIKGVAANMSFMDLADRAKNAEAAAKQQNVDACAALLPGVCEALQLAKQSVLTRLSD